MNQPFGISDCADPEWLNSRIEREEAERMEQFDKIMEAQR